MNNLTHVMSFTHPAHQVDMYKAGEECWIVTQSVPIGIQIVIRRSFADASSVMDILIQQIRALEN